MACCIAVTLIFAMLRTIRTRVFWWNKPTVDAFAAPARRPAAGEVLPIAGTDESRTRGNRSAASHALVASILYGWAISGPIYLVAVTLAIRSGSFTTVAGPALPQPLRVLLLLAIGLAALLAGRRAQPAAPAIQPALVITGVGSGFFFAGIVDMHVLGSFSVDSLAADALFHGAGLALVVISTMRFLRNVPLPSPRRSAV